ncbi:MAG: efflux RND transporter permease subunit [Betaproteobacteria bacterium]|nr:efflux RND transporter permease subunit [Betaproteobacteria bacterium]
MNPVLHAVLRYRGLVLLLAMVLAASGWLAWLKLPVDAFPDISPTQAKIILKIPGMTPEEVELRVVKPIELELLSIPRKTMVRSMSKYGIADITIDFESGVDIYWARQQVSERLSGVMDMLPATVQGGLAPITTPLSEMFMFTVEGDSHSLEARRRVLDWVIRPELRTISGVANVNALGGRVAAVEVVPDAARMARFGITMQDLREALAQNNANDGAGRVIAGEEALVVRIEGALNDLDALRRIRLQAHEGVSQGSKQLLLVDDVATVSMGSLTRYGAVSADGRGETVQGLVLGMRGANAREVVTAVKLKLADIEKRLPDGMSLRVFYDRGDLVTRASNTVIKALAEAALLVCLVLYLFLGGWRAAVVVAVSLPLSLLATCLLMRYSGQTANLMSLGGLAIALGMLVDASVVVVENIEACFAQQPPQGFSQRLQVLTKAIEEVVKPVVSGVLIIAIVFIPLLTLEGLEGRLFSRVAITIVMALACSLVVAFLVVLSLALFLLKPQTHGAHLDPWLMRVIFRAYVNSRDRLSALPMLLYGVVTAMLLAAISVYFSIGKTFMPTMDEGDILIQVQKLASSSLESSIATDSMIQQQILAKVPEVKSIVARVGSDEIGLDPMGLNETDLFLIMKPSDQWRGPKESVVDALREVMEQFPGIDYGFTQPIEMRVSEMLTGARGDVAVKVFGDDLQALNDAAQLIAKSIHALPGAAEVIAPKVEGFRYLRVLPDRYRLGELGISVESFQRQLRMALEGETVGVMLEGSIRTPIIIRGDERLRENLDTLARLKITGEHASAYSLETLARLEMVDGPIRVDHEQGQRFANVQVSVEGRDLTGFVQEAQSAVQALALPAALRVTWGGQFENQQRAAARLGLVIPASIVMIFIILMLTFGSMSQALLVLLNVPFALVGGVFALALSGEYLSVPASVGFIALLGIAVLNGVVMVSHFNERIATGEAIETAIRKGAERRLRPVLMTALIAALGMVPLLFATGPGSEIQRPLAIVVTGGLLSSTLLTLYLLPRVFVWTAGREHLKGVGQ